MQAGKQINVQKHEHPINKKSHKLGGTRLGKMDQQEVNFLVPSRVASCRNLKNTVREKTTGERKWQKSRHRALFIPKEGKETLEVNLKKERTRRGLATKSWVRESVMRREGISTPTHP